MTLNHRCCCGMLVWWLAVAAATAAPAAPQSTPFVVYYSDEAAVEAFDDYELVVFDSMAHPPIERLRKGGKTVLAYLSVGEIAVYRPGYRAADRAGILLSINPNWPDSRMVDLRRQVWTRFLIEEQIPAILAHGFYGMFLDTLDNASHLERLDPERFQGMSAAAVELVRGIHARYPDRVLMMNRGFDLLPEVEDVIDIVLGESVRADYDFETKRYQLVDQQSYREQVAMLAAAKTRHPELRVFTLDYWDPDDRDGIAEIYRAQRANGFTPYVATIDLDRIVPEPRP